MPIKATLKELDWESHFFAKKIGLFALAGSQEIAEDSFNRFDLVQAKVLSSDYSALDTLTGLGFRLAESEADFCLPTKQTARQQDVRLARPVQIPLLRIIAAQLFTLSRYREPWFTRQQNQALYAQWVENAVLGHFDNLCLVMSATKGQVDGFVTIRLQHGYGRIGLLGVAASAQGNGCGLQLLCAAADWARIQGCSELRVATQPSNIIAMRLYQRAGAKLATFHHWFYR